MLRSPSTSADRRQGGPAIPEPLDRVLSLAQRQELRQVENFGWRLVCVRHPGLRAPIAVVQNSDNHAYAVINEQGELEFSPDLRVRHQDSVAA